MQNIVFLNVSWPLESCRPRSKCLKDTARQTSNTAIKFL